ncbi:hypothetical protein conserved [Leishmania donovani]|nr:hypothetical protein CGC20_16165 [Leishmania donovani]CAJ1988840.1 hypothetical protein conserved [Leishmania donovani]VDZ44718.1 hypothetical_protein_conserved [Leishmania donovani]
MNSNVAGDSSGDGRSESLSRGGASTTSSASSAPPVTVTFVTNGQEFAAAFECEGSTFSVSGSGSNITTGHSRGGDAFVLCYEHPGDGVTAEHLLQFKNSVTAAAQQYGARLRLFVWDCTSPSFAAARVQLGKRHGHPLLLVVVKGAVADTLRDMPLTEMSATEVPRVCSRLASFQSSAKPARVSTIVTATSTAESSGAASPPQEEAEQHLSVDVAKMVGMGKRLMAERQPFYAEKFFVKALRTLDAVAADVDRLVASREDYDHSVALCLAWAGLAQLVQGKQTVENAYLERLEREAALQPFRDAPLNDANRALTTWRLMQGAPRPWSETRDSEAKLQAALSSNAHDTVARSLFVITLFLKGDLERAMTEALKLHVYGDAFGCVALKHMSRFLGKDHVLVERLGMPALTESI